MIEAPTMLALAGAHFWQAALVAAVVFLVLLIGRRVSGHARYGLAAAGFLAALALPAAAFLPSEGVLRWAVQSLNAPVALVTDAPANDERSAGASGWIGERESGVGALSAEEMRALSAVLARQNSLRDTFAPAGRPETAQAGLHEITLPALPAGVGLGMLLVWALVSAVLLVRLGLDVLAVERLVARAGPLNLPAHLRARFEGVRILASPDAEGPMAAGLLKPAILLPQTSEAMLARPGAAALLEHERAHLVRGDVYAAFLQRLVLALLWWSPGLHWMSRRMDEERELACDEAAVRATGDARSFALRLTEEARARVLRAAPRLAVGVVGSRSRFSARVRRLIDLASGAAIGASGPVRFAVAGLALAVLVLALATPRIEANAQQTPSAPTQPVAPPTAPASPMPTAPQALPSPPVAPGAEAPPAPPKVDTKRHVVIELKRPDDAQADGEANAHGQSRIFSFSVDSSEGGGAAAGGEGKPKVFAFRTDKDGDGPAALLGENAEALAFDLSALMTEEALKNLPAMLGAVATQLEGTQVSEDVLKALEEAMKEIDGQVGADVQVEIRKSLEDAKKELGERRMSIVIARSALAEATEEMKAAHKEAAQAMADALAAERDAHAAANTAEREAARAAGSPERVMILRSEGPGARMERIDPATYGLNQALATTAAKGDTSAVRALLKAGADAKAVLPGQDSALIEGVRSGNYAVVRALLDAGADPNLAGPKGATPLSSVPEGKSAIARLLKARGASE